MEVKEIIEKLKYNREGKFQKEFYYKLMEYR